MALYAQVGGLVPLAAIVFPNLVAHPWGQDTGLLAALSGTLFAVGYVGLYRAFASGPLSVTSPVASAQAAFAALLAVIFLREVPSAPELLGIGSVALGILLSSTDRLDLALRSVRRTGGTGHALLAAVSLGGLLVVLSPLGERMGALEAALATRGVGVLVILLLAALGGGVPRPPATRQLGSALVVGLLDALGMTAYVLAATTGRVVIVSVLASLYSVVAVVLAFTLLRERLAAHQLAGLALIFAGIALMVGGDAVTWSGRPA